MPRVPFARNTAEGNAHFGGWHKASFLSFTAGSFETENSQHREFQSFGAMDGHYSDDVFFLVGNIGFRKLLLSFHGLPQIRGAAGKACANSFLKLSGHIDSFSHVGCHAASFPRRESSKEGVAFLKKGCQNGRRPEEMGHQTPVIYLPRKMRPFFLKSLEAVSFRCIEGKIPDFFQRKRG